MSVLAQALHNLMVISETREVRFATVIFVVFLYSFFSGGGLSSEALPACNILGPVSPVSALVRFT
jgi:hypothetical protein